MSEISKTIDDYVAESKSFVDDFIKKRDTANGDLLIHMLNTMVGYYDTLGTWCAQENSTIQEHKLNIREYYAIQFREFRQNGKTIKDAEQRAITRTIIAKKELNEIKAHYDEVLAWKKSLSKYIDITRSRLSYEKSLVGINNTSS